MIMEYQKAKKVPKNENDQEIFKEIPKERYISPKERQKIIDNLIPNITV